MPFTENQHYEFWANYYAGEAIILKCDASIHVEAFDDAVFWEKTFTYFIPDKRFNFIYHSLTPFGSDATGVSHCLKYRDYLSKQFFICIDSDYRYLKQETDISTANYILQTYTYSIENHLCYSTKLNTIAEKCTGVADNIFDFEAFLLDFSNAIYEAYIWYLHFLRQRDGRTFGKDEFSRILSLNGMPGFSISNNGKIIINELTTRCAAKVAELKATYPLADMATEQAHFTTLGLTPNNAYLYVRGHNVFDLIVKIGNEVNNQTLRLETSRLANEQVISELYAQATPFKRELERVIVFEGYEEIEKIGRDINTLLKKR